MISSDGPNCKGMKGQGSTTDRRGSDRRIKAEAERELKRTSIFKSKQNATNGDRAADKTHKYE